MSLFRTLLTNIGLAERRRDSRVDANGLTVTYSAGSEQRKVKIGNISPTGLYLITEDRWQPGTPVLLTLGERSIFEDRSRSQVKLWTHCVRADENGVGLTFKHSHIDRNKWLDAMSRAPSLIAANHPVQVFRLTRALAFLSHISPATDAAVLKLITENLTRERTERAIEIALLADDLLESQSGASKTTVEPGLVLRVLEFAVQVEEAEIRDYWARLLAASSLSDSQDAMNRVLAGLLARMNQLHLRILVAAWKKAKLAGFESRSGTPPAVCCNIEEVKAMGGVAHAERIEGVVNDLHEFRLLGNTERPTLFNALAEVNLSLSELGAKFCETCFNEPPPIENASPNPPVCRQYVPLDRDDVMSPEVRQRLSDSLAAEARNIRQSSSVALLD
jgi:PilZ domain